MKLVDVLLRDKWIEDEAPESLRYAIGVAYRALKALANTAENIRFKEHPHFFPYKRRTIETAAHLLKVLYDWLGRELKEG